MNNADKACVIYNAKGKGDQMTLENIGGEKLTSLDENQSEKLLGLHVSRDFNWKMHVDKLIIDLNKKIGLMRRVKNRLPRRKVDFSSLRVYCFKPSQMHYVFV